MRVAIMTAILIVVLALITTTLFKCDETCGFGVILGVLIGTGIYVCGLI